MSGRVGEHIRNNIYGLVAIFIALTASAYAVSAAPKNSVTSKSIKNGQVKTKDVADDSLTGTDINESTLKGVQGPAGANGARGATGAQGAQGTAGQAGATGAAGSINGVAAGGDLSGSYPNPTIANGAVDSAKVNDDSLTATDINEASLGGAVLQNRVGSTCTAGNSIRAIASDGTVTCEADDSGGAPTGSAGGDLAGTYPNPTVGSNAIGTNEVDSTLTGSDVSDAGGGSLTGTDISESSLDAAVLQSRVSSTCAAGTSIRAVAQNGTVTCETDDDTTAPSGSAGGDLSGTYPNPSVANVQPNAVALGTDTTGNYVATLGSSTGLTGGSGGSEGAPLTLAFDYSSSLASSPVLASAQSTFSSTGLIFEGTNANTIETLLTPADPTVSDKTITLPDASGTVALQNQSASFTDLTVGSGSTISGIFQGSATLDFGQIAAQTCVNAGTIPVTGASTADPVALGVESAGIVSNVNYTAFVSSANTVAVRACNVASSASTDAPSAAFRATVFE
jgi:hypothetical protein